MEKLNFENLLKELEETVKKLEDKDIALDDAIKYYQKGLELSKQLTTLIEDAEKLIVKEG